MELTKEFLGERVKNFHLKVLELREELIRFEAVEEYTNGLIEYLEKEVEEAPDGKESIPG
jgi:hypothetical protein